VVELTLFRDTEYWSFGSAFRLLRADHAVLRSLQMIPPVAGSLAIALVEGQVSVVQGSW